MQIRDHTAPTPAMAVTLEDARLKVQQAIAAKEEINFRLAPLLEKVNDGSATPEELAAVPELAEEARVFNLKLERARVELQVAEQLHASKIAEANRERFDELVAETRQKRAEFARLYKEACLLLGQLCANVDEAAGIANEFAAETVAGMMPTDRNAIAEMSERIDPLPALLDSGLLSPTDKFGWNLTIPIVPLKGKL